MNNEFVAWGKGIHLETAGTHRIDHRRAEY